jgi:DNA-binding NtrC family response regulator
VKQPSIKPTALIVDDDLGFVWWLGELLHEAGYGAIPATRAVDAIPLVKSLKIKIDLAFVNPSLPGAERMIEHLAAEGPIKVVVISEGSELSAGRIRAHAILERPSGWEVFSRQEWLRKLRRILRRVETTPTILKIDSGSR